MTATVAALFVAAKGPYANDPTVDAWTKERDARTYAGNLPIVGHSPCERWGAFAKGGPTAKRPFEVGDDGGCFAFALATVRRVGGVLEHPRGSKAWAAFGLPVPSGRGWSPADEYGGRSCYIDQGAYGHPAKKPTWLYAVLPSYPEMRWERVWGRPRIGGDGFHTALERKKAKARTTPKRIPNIQRKWRWMTPEDLKVQLLEMARSCAGWTPTRRQTQATLRSIEPEGATV